VHNSLVENLLFLFASVALELVGTVERVALNVLEREDVAKNVIFCTDTACGTQLEAPIAFGTTKVAELAFKLEPA
jgi:hypothetical protein